MGGSQGRQRVASPPRGSDGEWGYYAADDGGPSTPAKENSVNNPGKCPSVFQSSGLHTFGPASEMSRASSSGLFTILAIYSLMNGATLHVMPQLFYEAGLCVSVVMTGLIGTLSWYSCGLIVQIGGYSTQYHDFSDCVADYFEDVSERRCTGEVGRYVALTVSVLMMMGVCLSYHYIIVGTAVELLGAVGACEPASRWYCNRWLWTALTSALLFLLSYLQLRYQIRICVAGVLCFVVGMLLTLVLDVSSISFSNMGKFNDVLYYGESVNALCGILFISFFVHNVVLPIVKSQRNPRTSDLAVSYGAVGVTYVLVGCFGALALHERQEEDEGAPRRWPVADTVRDIALILHALTFYPLMTVIFRQQVRPPSGHSELSPPPFLPPPPSAEAGGASGAQVIGGLLRQRVKQQSPGGLGGAAAGGGTRVRDYLRMFVVTLLMVGFSGGITGAFPALDKVCPPPRLPRRHRPLFVVHSGSRVLCVAGGDIDADAAVCRRGGACLLALPAARRAHHGRVDALGVFHGALPLLRADHLLRPALPRAAVPPGSARRYHLDTRCAMPVLMAYCRCPCADLASCL